MFKVTDEKNVGGSGRGNFHALDDHQDFSSNLSLLEKSPRNGLKKGREAIKVCPFLTLPL